MAGWSSSTPSVALVGDQVHNKGVVTAISAGVTVITAELDGETDTAEITVQ